MSESSTPKRRGLGSVADMVRSMGLVTMVVALLSIGVWWPSSQEPVKAIDLASIAVGAAKQADFTLVVPKLPQAWRPTSARIEKVAQDASRRSWHIGYVSPAGSYFALEQSDTVLVEDFLKTWTDGLEPAAAPVRVEGLDWQVYSGAGQTQVYVRQLADSVICLVADQSVEGSAFVAAVSQELA